MAFFPGAVPDYVKHGAGGLFSKCPSAPAHSGDSETSPSSLHCSIHSKGVEFDHLLQ